MDVGFNLENEEMGSKLWTKSHHFTGFNNDTSALRSGLQVVSKEPKRAVSPEAFRRKQMCPAEHC